jgi:bifunctional non-homologous end joining protein LigD
MKQIAQDRDAEWESNRPNEKGEDKESARARIRKAVAKKRSAAKEKIAPDILKSLPSAKPRFIAVMKPKLRESAPTKGDWIYELKFDGFRVLAIKEGAKVQLISRNENDLTKKFPEIAEAIAELPCKECVIDGEVVALDEAGRSSFQLLQAREMETRKAPLYDYVFDLLQLEGKSLLNLPLTSRKEILCQVCDGVGDPIRYSSELGREAAPLLKQVQQLGLEGIIGKEAKSIYEPGRRSGAWIKLKCVNEQEFVIGGYTPPAGSRKHFGALLVGYYEGKKLLFAGKVGTGFNTRLLASLHKKFQAEARDDCPFADLPSKQGGQWVQGITPGMMRKCHWVNPVFVAQVKFAEWTRDAKLRQPVFLGLREDKSAQEVKREVA